jgi:predicted metal-dependent peptidase
MSRKLDKLLSFAKIELMKSGSIFLTSLALGMTHKFTKEVPTAATNGLEVFFNPDFFESLSKKERTTLLAHEAWHVALSHMLRRDERDKDIYNQAGDYVINQLLVDSGMAPLVKVGVNDEVTWLQDDKFRNKTTNQVYDEIFHNPPAGNSGSNDIIYAEGGQGEGDTPDSKSKAEVENKIKSLLVKANTQSKMQGEKPGNIPEEIQRAIDALINPVLPWQQLLSQFLTDRIKDDYSWTRPNRRYMPDFYLPSQNSEALGHITVAIDTSGSVGQDDIIKMLSEIQYIKDTLKPSRMTVLSCDTQIHDIHDVTDDQHMTELSIRGGGGTRCDPVMEYCKKENTTVLLYFTDLEMSDYNGEINFPLLWIVYDNPRASNKHGEIIHYQI